MAGEKKTRQRQRAARGEASEGGEGGLRQRSDPYQERRYEPREQAFAVLWWVAMSVSGVLLGAGAYGQWLRAEALGPHQASMWLLLGGAAMLIGVLLLGQRTAKPIRVGDAGVAVEKDADLERIAWRHVTRVMLGGDMLTIQSAGTSISIPLKQHAGAAARALAEARARIPKRVDKLEGDGLPAPDDADGQIVPLDPPQAAGMRCKATDKLIAFEKDARVCGRCGEVYHKESVPGACLTCGAKLKA
jgi:hypothetical protein